MIRYHARWLLPVADAPIGDGTVVEDHGRIAYVGPRSEAPPGGEDVELGESVLLPGLVNAHCHLELTAMRGFLDGLDFRAWILRLTQARAAVMDHAAMLDAARLGIEEGLRAGITTYADTGDSGTGFDAMLEAGVRGICYREVFGPDPAQCEEAIQKLRAQVTGMLDRESALVRVGVSPHAPYTVSDALFRATAALAAERSLPLAVHIAESALETALVVDAAGAFADGLRGRGIDVTSRGRSPIALLQSLGVLDLRPLLIHCVRVDEEDVRLIAEHRCGVAHCPASNARLAHGIAPLRELLDAGIAVGLGSDSVASNDRMDLLDEARLAALVASARTQRVADLPAPAALSLATLDGARALGLSHEIGSLQVGKAADLAAFPLAGSGRAPTHDPVAATVFALAGTPAALTVVGGRILVRDGRLMSPQIGLPARVQRTADALQAWLAAGGEAVAGSRPTPGR